MKIVKFRVEEFCDASINEICGTYLLHGSYKTYEQAEKKCKKLMEIHDKINLRIVKRVSIIDETVEQVFRKRRII